MNADELANIFKQLPPDEKARFFNSVGTEENLSTTLKKINKSPALDFRGRMAMSMIGNHAQVQK